MQVPPAWISIPVALQLLHNKTFTAKEADTQFALESNVQITFAAHKKLSFCAYNTPPNSSKCTGIILPG